MLCELGKPWVHEAELRPTSSVLAFMPYGSHGAIAYLPVRPRHGCWGLLRPEHPPTHHLRVSLHSQRTSGKCALTVRRRRSPSCGSGWCSWRSGWSPSWAPGRGLSKRQVLLALGRGGDRDSPGSRRGAGLLLELVVLSLLLGRAKLHGAEAQKCSRLLLMLSLTRGKWLFSASLRINILKLPSSLKSHFCTRTWQNSTLVRRECEPRVGSCRVGRGSVVGLGVDLAFGYWTALCSGHLSRKELLM